MQAFIAGQQQSRWWILISDALTDCSLELDDKAVPVDDLLEMLAEEQRGLMLLTAHRAKGLEFDDVVILDGGWGRTSRGEDQDAPRRLLYVAMTRARRSLAIATVMDRHAIIGADTTGLLQRTIATDKNHGAESSLRYPPVEPQMVDLSWVGRQGAESDAHYALAQLRTGDQVSLVQVEGRWLILDEGGVAIGRMAQSYRPPTGLHFIRGTARAFIQWRKLDNSEEFQGTIRRETWEVVLPEFVFGRGEGSG